METRALGQTGLTVTRLGFGGIPLQRPPEPEARAVVRRALDQGCTFFDTARAYQASERLIGEALEGDRDRVVLATKSLARTAEAMAADVARSLVDLRTDRIDLYQAHAVGDAAAWAAVTGPGGALEALQAARAAGRIRAIGLTTHSPEIALLAADHGVFQTLQVPWNPLERQFLPAVERAWKHGLGTIAMKPLAGGALGPVATLALRHSLAAGIDVVIPGLDDPAQADEIYALGDGPYDLDAAEADRLAAEVARWQGRFCHRCGYCMPCPNGLNIPMLLLFDAYTARYGLGSWSAMRLGGLSKFYTDCEACGECVARCPYALQIPELMKEAAARDPRRSPPA